VIGLPDLRRSAILRASAQAALEILTLSQATAARKRDNDVICTLSGRLLPSTTFHSSDADRFGTCSRVKGTAGCGFFSGSNTTRCRSTPYALLERFEFAFAGRGRPNGFVSLFCLQRQPPPGPDSVGELAIVETAGQRCGNVTVLGMIVVARSMHQVGCHHPRRHRCTAICDHRVLRTPRLDLVR
jgi:hypothetical protein